MPIAFLQSAQPFRRHAVSLPHHRFSCCSTSAPTAAPKHPIEVNNLSFSWANGRVAFEDVSFSVPAGRICMIVGANGCGKSTLLRTMRHILRPTAGSVHLEMPSGFVFQDPNFQIVMPTIGSDIALTVPRGPETTDDDVKQVVFDELEAIGLSPGRYFARMSSHRVSGGQRQRVVVAATLAAQPKTILFDEATASLDPLNKALLISRVRRTVTERKLAAVWVTHLFDELNFADEIIIMDAGRVVAQGPRVAMMPYVYELYDPPS